MSPAPSGLSGQRAAGARPLFLFLLLSAAIWLICLYRQQLVILNEDVIWLIVAAGRLLDGARLGADIVEVNTPIAVLLYLPAALLMRWLHLPMAPAHHLATSLMILASLGLTAAILRPVWLGNGMRPWLWPVLQAVFLAFSLQAYHFGQRDSLVFMFLLPLIAYLAVLLTGGECRLSLRMAIGIAAALAIAIKPHYLPVAISIYGLRIWRFGFQSLLKSVDLRAAVLAGLALLAISFAIFPDWLEMVRFTIRFYLPISHDTGFLFGDFFRQRMPAIAIAAIGALLWWRLPKTAPLRPLITALLVTEPAFLLAYFLQARGYAYHLIPFEMASGLAGFLAILSLLAQPFGRARMALGVSALLAAFAVFATAALQTYNLQPERMAEDRVVAAVHRYDRGNGMALLDIRGPPAIFAIPIFGTKMAARGQSLWAIQSIERVAAPDRDAFLQSVIADFRRFQPDVVVVNRTALLPDGRNMADRLNDEPAFAEIWSNYRLVEETRSNHTDFAIYARE
ncbi:hypothetical protein [Dongia sp.]|uniref:hypothetical protein n=1 Tax=Dongia sp. TaxID=1977262 RepID=UPI0035AEF909